MSFSRQIAPVDTLPNSDHPGYIVGNWYLPLSGSAVSGGLAPGANSIRLYPAYVRKTITLDTLGVAVTTLSAAGNVQAAVYAANTATGRPTGTALASTASMSTGAVANVNAAVSIQLSPTLYWWATNCDNATAVFVAQSSTSMLLSTLIGSTTQGNVLNTSNGSLSGLSVSQAFGSWPDLTAGSFTELATSQRIPLVQFKVASVP